MLDAVIELGKRFAEWQRPKNSSHTCTNWMVRRSSSTSWSIRILIFELSNIAFNDDSASIRSNELCNKDATATVVDELDDDVFVVVVFVVRGLVIVDTFVFVPFETITMGNSNRFNWIANGTKPSNRCFCTCCNT